MVFALSGMITLYSIFAVLFVITAIIVTIYLITHKEEQL